MEVTIDNLNDMCSLMCDNVVPQKGEGMVQTRITTETYKYDENYYIDIVSVDDQYEAWLYNKRYGIKELMWGEPKEQSTYEEFIKLVEQNIDDYIELYKERVED